MAKKILFLFMLLLSLTGMLKAQVTTAGMSGKVMADEESVIGATVVAVHEPSGTSYGTVTNVDGRFSLQGMRSGGPYKVTVSYIGYQTAIYTGIQLQLGETYSLNVTLHEASELLGEITITASKSKFSAEKTGATTNISSEQLTTLPSINRSISDFTRISPYASGNSFGGRDGRSNTFTVDGANLNNNFGLSSGLPGGGNPISLDAIDEVQVVIAPYDVRQANFIGAGINAITKSGTNAYRGSAYMYFNNEVMRGNKIGDTDFGVRAEESKTVYGATFGGPIGLTIGLVYWGLDLLGAFYSPTLAPNIRKDPYIQPVDNLRVVLPIHPFPPTIIKRRFSPRQTFIGPASKSRR